MSYQQREGIGQKIRNYVENNYSIEVLVDKLEELLNKEVKRNND